MTNWVCLYCDIINDYTRKECVNCSKPKTLSPKQYLEFKKKILHRSYTANLTNKEINDLVK